ncbi:MAG: hypothetical protein H0U85_09585 [Gemmatimonadales bacterium]|nr:hypothetical protein [Gemmatimonadales bacterium]
MRRTTTVRRRATLYLGLCALTGLGACSSDPTGTGPALSSATSADAAAAAQDETEQGADAFTLDGIGDPTGASFSSGALAGTASGAPFSASLSSIPARIGCATVSSTADADNDGAPDNAVLTFALPACHFDGFRGGSLELTGTITVSDPTPSSADFAFHSLLTDFTFKATNAQNESFTAVRNGTRDLTGNGAGLTLANNVTTVRTASGRPSMQVVHNLQFSFTPAAGSTLARGAPLPSGTISEAGTLTFTRGTESRTFTVSTPTPLEYDASCSGPRRARIRAGEVHWTLASGGYVRVVWTACGARPTRTFVPAA